MNLKTCIKKKPKLIANYLTFFILRWKLKN